MVWHGMAWGWKIRNNNKKKQDGHVQSRQRRQMIEYANRQLGQEVDFHLPVGVIKSPHVTSPAWLYLIVKSTFNVYRF